MSLPIFLAEDDPSIRQHLTDAMNAVCDAEVVAWADCEKASIAWMKAHHDEWKLAVLDLFLKQGTGFGILRSLTDAEAREKVIVLTNSATAENRALCLRLGARAVYDKTSQLDEFLDHCLRHHRQDRTGA